MTEHDVLEVVDRFNAAWGDHDLDAALALCTADVVFESTGPAPDGERFEGRDAVRGAWQPIFEDTAARFTSERAFATTDHLVQCWRYDWDSGHVRGVDVIDVRDGLVAAKLSYVKG